MRDAVVGNQADVAAGGCHRRIQDQVIIIASEWQGLQEDIAAGRAYPHTTRWSSAFIDGDGTIGGAQHDVTNSRGGKITQGRIRLLGRNGNGPVRSHAIDANRPHGVHRHTILFQEIDAASTCRSCQRSGGDLQGICTRGNTCPGNQAQGSAHRFTMCITRIRDGTTGGSDADRAATGIQSTDRDIGCRLVTDITTTRLAQGTIYHADAAG